MDGRWSLAGRDQELNAIVAALDTRGVVLAGSAGVGKSRLAAEVMSRLAANGRSVAHCAATASATSVPFGAITHLLADQATRPAADLTTLFTFACDQISTRFAGGVLVVDDAHLLDEPSAATIHRLALTGGVSLLVVIRTPHETPAAIDALWKDELLPRLDLQPLSRNEVRALLEEECGGAVSDQTVSRLHAITSGNPLFLRELMVEARATDALVRRDGVWWWSGVVTGTPRLTTAVAQAVARLTPESHQVLELLALIEPLPVDVAEDALGAAAVASALRERVARVDAEGALRLRHPLLGEVTRAAGGGVSEQRLVRRVAASLLARPGVWPVLSTQLALLHLRSGVEAPLPLLVTAAVHAAFSGDPALGQRLARAALSLEPGSFEARIALGRSLYLTSDFAAAQAELAQLVGREADDAAIATLAYARAVAVLFDGADALVEARAMVTDARERVVDPQWRAMLDGVLAELTMNESDLETARAMSAGVLENDAAAPEARIHAAHILSLSETLTGHGRRGADIAVRHWPLAQAVADTNPIARGWMLLDRFLGLAYAAPIDEALEFCDWLTSDTEPIAPAFEGSACFFHGRLHLLAGRPATAERWLRQAVGSLRTYDARGYLHWALGALGAGCALQGKIAAAEEATAEGAAGGAWAARRLFDADRLLMSCWVMAASGQLSAAAAHAEAIGSVATSRGQVAFGALALHDAVRLGSAGARTALVEVAARNDTPPAAAFGRHAAALLADDAAGLSAVSVEFHRLGLEIFAAEASLEAAQLLRDEGRMASARAATATANSILAGCEGIRTPIVDRSERPDVGLTPREDEIIRRAARGLTNRQIAEELFTSVRTVEGHLLRAFAKLGITSRSELAGVLALPEAHRAD